MANFTDLELLILEKESVTCADVDALTYEYVEGELSESIRGRLDTHICSCEYCQENLWAYRETISLARELRDELQPVPTRVKQNLRKALNERLGLSLPLGDS
ncbi:MAG: zf-HC2 domain-containing protein [Bdellovibrionales bacterium]|nr:zf-HC2 domain-containing protein [Bdellovibrionales bacterium]